MSADWLDEATAARKLTTEADALAAKLGHKMTDWVHHKAGWRARCVKTGCNASADVSPRSFGRAPIRGEAVTFSCKRRSA